MGRLLVAAVVCLALASAGRGEPAQPSADGAPMVVAQNDQARPTEPLLRKSILDLQRGSPDFDSFEPALQAAVRAQQWTIVLSLQGYGALGDIRFAAAAGGIDTYTVAFRNGLTTWSIGVSATGKIHSLLYRPVLGPEKVGEDVATAGLSGTLIKPAGVARPPVVLLIAGSGPTDRNGNQNGIGPANLRLLAEELAARGVASLRYDKRSVGRSPAPNLLEESMTIEKAAADTGAWAAWLADRGDLGPLILAGHSEGGIIALLLAHKSPPAKLVLLATPGRSLADLMLEQLRASGLAPDLLEEAVRVVAALQRGETVAQVSPVLMALFRPSVQPFLRSVFAVDPAKEFASLAMPALIVSGGHDVQVLAADAEALARARPDATRVHIADMNHVFKATPADRAAQQRFYFDPTVPLAPGLVDAVAEFVNRAR